MDKISVIVPVYNVENYLNRCLDALCNQTHKELEIILVDDGSTDESGKICDAYAKQDARVKVVHKENGGTSSARNRGLEEATGEYVGFLDSDDWPEKDMYENLLRAIKKEENALVSQMMSRDYLDTGELVKPPYKDSEETHFLPVKEYFRELMLHVGDSSFCTKLFLREFIKDYRFEQNKLNEDFELILQMLPRLSGVVTLEKVGYNIELRSGSNTRGKYNQSLYEAMLTNADKALALSEELFCDCKEEAIRFKLVQALDFLLHIPVERMRKDNDFYVKIKKWVKGEKEQIRKNPYLDAKQRRNLILLSYGPMKTIRWVHGLKMKWKNK